MGGISMEGMAFKPAMKPIDPKKQAEKEAKQAEKQAKVRLPPKDQPKYTGLGVSMGLGASMGFIPPPPSYVETRVDIAQKMINGQQSAKDLFLQEQSAKTVQSTDTLVSTKSSLKNKLFGRR